MPGLELADRLRGFNRISGVDKTAHNVQVPSSYVSNWSNLTRSEVHYMINWTDNVLRLASSLPTQTSRT